MPPLASGGFCYSSSFLPALKLLSETLGHITVSVCPMTMLTRWVWNIPWTVGDWGITFTWKKKVRWERREFKLSHSPNFSVFMVQEAEPILRIGNSTELRFFLPKTREAIIMISRYPLLCYQTSLFTRENF